jgi:hypothetical protein
LVRRTYGTGFGSLPSHSIPTPTASDHIERKSTSTETLNLKTNKSVSLDRWAKHWPTPTSRDYRSERSTAEYADKRNAETRGKTLPWAVLWPTPTAVDGRRGTGTYRPQDTGIPLPQAVAMERIPTPTANRRDGLQSHGVNVVSGSLNPTWVEWLMGFPLGWTDCGDSATPSSRKSRKPSAAQSSPQNKLRRPRRDTK